MLTSVGNRLTNCKYSRAMSKDFGNVLLSLPGAVVAAKSRGLLRIPSALITASANVSCRQFKTSTGNLKIQNQLNSVKIKNGKYFTACE